MAALAGKQFGRVRSDQLREAGVSEPTTRRWVADGYLHRELPGVYAVGHAATTTQSDLAAAVLYAGAGAALSHGTAAWWWGLIKHPPAVPHVSTPKRRKSRRGQIRVHGRREFVRVHRNGLPVTTVEQTLLDFAAGADRELLRFALANADFAEMLDIPALDAICGRGAAGSAPLRAALEAHRPELAHTRSEPERVLLAICEAHALPLPKLNVYRHGWLVDAVWDQQRVVVELDGYRSHRTKAQLESDHRRDLELRAAGFTVLRYTWRQLTETPEAVALDIGRHLTSA